MDMTDLAERFNSVIAELDLIHERYGSDPASMPAGQRQRAENLRRAADSITADMHAAEARERAAERNERMRQYAINNPQAREPGFAVPQAMASRSNPWAGPDGLFGESPAGWRSRAHDVLGLLGGLSDQARNTLAEAVDASRTGGIAAEFVVARSDPHYQSAFEKVLLNPERAFHTFTPAESASFDLVERIRASLGTGTGTAGYVIPLAMDPNLAAIVNDGIASPFRSMATVKTTISSPHRAITSAGITPTWTAEGAAVDATDPTFGKVDVPLFKMTAWVTASFELLEDAGSAINTALPNLFADARLVAEGGVFATGNGTTQPKGLVTAISGTAGSTVTATTRGSFTAASAVDTLALLNAVPARARQSGRAAAFANLTHITTIRSQTVGTAGVPVVDMGSAVPTPLGVPLHESSAMSSATTSGTVMVVAGDMSKYLIVDSVAGPTIEYVPIVFDQATGRPNGTRGWLYHQRTGADVLDVTQFRFLKA